MKKKHYFCRKKKIAFPNNKIESMKKLLLVLAAMLTMGYALAQQKEMRGVWIATVANIDWPSRQAIGDMERQKKEMLTMLDTLQSLKFNMIVFQVRPTADALFQSELEPVSKWLVGKQNAKWTNGTMPYDPLAFTCEEAHKRGIEVHVWLNPYRVTGGGMKKEDLAPEHIYYQHPEWFVQYGKQWYFNPGLDEVRAYLNRVVADIVDRYDVDAIHFDDYFYPYRVAGEEFPDHQTFADYPRGFDNIDDWRRNNTNMVIEELSQTIKSRKPWVEFGISPFGVWRNQKTDPVRGSATQAGVQNYDDLYADILLWLERGWIDYVAPQLYWEIGKKVADYEVLLKWWSENLYGKKLYIGMAPYRLEPNPEKAAKLTGTNKAWGEANEICRQLRMNRQNALCSGSIMYPIHSLMENPLGLQDSLRTEFYTEYVETPSLKKADFEPKSEPVEEPTEVVTTQVQEQIQQPAAPHKKRGKKNRK